MVTRVQKKILGVDNLYLNRGQRVKIMEVGN